MIHLSDLQRVVMTFIADRATKENIPIAQQEVVAHLKTDFIKPFKITNALKSLEKRGYIRRSALSSNKTFYIQLRPL